MPLTMVNSEETQIIRKVGGKEETRKFLEGMGFVTGGCVVKADRGGLTPSDKIDRIVTNRILALPIFALVMFGVYYIAMVTVGAFCTDWTNDVLFGEIVPPAIEGILTAAGCADWLSGLILGGIAAGVGAVLGFVPQMFVLFILLAILEGLGGAVKAAHRNGKGIKWEAQDRRRRKRWEH